MRRKPFWVVVSVVVCLLVTLALAGRSWAQQPADNKSAVNPLVRVLQAKGILTAEEVAQLNQASSASDADQRLAKLLLMKGVISQVDYDQTVGTPSMIYASAPAANSPTVIDAVYRVPINNGASVAPARTPPPEGPKVIPAVTPVRVLPIDVPKQGGLIPDIKLGSGASVKLYGFFKASAVSDTASSGGVNFGSNDFPLPLLIGGDTGPTGDPQVHIKARSFRVGSQFEWAPKDSNLVLTGKVEADYEGDFTNANSVNISSVRNGQFRTRLAWARLDTKLGGSLPWFAEFGQDWALYSSSLPAIYETTGTAIGMGALWERVPQFRTGVQFHSGDLKIQPEFAIVLPVAGAGLTDELRARFGDRAGAESNQPGLESRIVLQFPLSHNWQAVAPAQLIVSGHHARINEIIPAVSLSATAVPGSTGCATPPCSLLTTFPHGIQAGNPQNIWTAEAQLPTPWVTWVTKYYRGDDMRFPFGGQLNDVFTDLNNTTSVGSAVSFTGKSIPFGCLGGTTVGGLNCNGNPITIGSLRPIRGQGGFSELSFPLSRIFHADPGGHNAGWMLHLMYGTDRANAADTRRPGGNGLLRTDLDTASLTYKVNSWMSIIHEASYIDTRAANRGGKTFRGIPATQAHSWRNEFGTIFTF